MKKVKGHLRYRFSSLELELRYKTLIEEAYNLRQTDAGLSDYAAYEAHKMIGKSSEFGGVTVI